MGLGYCKERSYAAMYIKYNFKFLLTLHIQASYTLYTAAVCNLQFKKVLPAVVEDNSTKRAVG